jgi:hypothetical protein
MAVFICTECGPLNEVCTHFENHQLKKELKFLHGAVLEIIHLLLRQTGFSVSQLQGDTPMPITGIVAGATGVFQETPTPQGAVIPAGTIPVWTSSDTTNAPAVASADGTQCSVAVPASATITSFTLSVQNQDGTFPTSVTVPVTPAPPPAQTGFEINQVS